MAITFNIQESSDIHGVYIIKPSSFIDFRGAIWTSYLEDELNNLIPENISFKHDKFSFTKNNILRGIHSDAHSWKLVSCVYGEVFQVVVDCRNDSNTCNQYESFLLDANNHTSILMPPMVGNAFFVNSANALYHYKLAYAGDYIDANAQKTWKWNDKRFGIKWPTKNPSLSERDI